MNGSGVQMRIAEVRKRQLRPTRVAPPPSGENLTKTFREPQKALDTIPAKTHLALLDGEKSVISARPLPPNGGFKRSQLFGQNNIQLEKVKMN
ncbi:MAG: hypothetical protein HZA94_02670 [Candidatus Vogelbacteria bacterium]|nr:hypothetical protein [Candidatus Vogelbacteria bacterium]